MLEEMLEGMELSAGEELLPDTLELQEQLEAYQQKYESAVRMGYSDAAQIYEKQSAELREELEAPAAGEQGEVSFCGRGSDLAKDSKELREARREYERAAKTIRQETERLNPNDRRLESSEISLKHAEKKIDQLERRIDRQTR